MADATTTISEPSSPLLRAHTLMTYNEERSELQGSKSPSTNRLAETTQRAKFLDLPRELRDLVYGYALDRRSPHFMLRNISALALSCRQVHRETVGPFICLPRTIRDKIYGYAFAPNPHLEYYHSFSRKAPGFGFTRRLAMAQTCHFIRKEVFGGALPLNLFRVSLFARPGKDENEDKYPYRRTKTEQYWRMTEVYITMEGMLSWKEFRSLSRSPSYSRKIFIDHYVRNVFMYFSNLRRVHVLCVDYSHLDWRSHDWSNANSNIALQKDILEVIATRFCKNGETLDVTKVPPYTLLAV